MASMRQTVTLPEDRRDLMDWISVDTRIEQWTTIPHFRELMTAGGRRRSQLARQAASI